MTGAGFWGLKHTQIRIPFRHWLEAAGLDAIVLTGLHGLELILFFCDLLATTAWAIKAAGKAIRDILSD